jgi:sec-independent protein translocase protein TatA
LLAPAAGTRYPARVGYFQPWHIVVFLLIALLLFGGKRLPEIGRSLGHGMREFKDAVTGHSSPDATDAQPELPPAEPTDTTATATTATPPERETV